MNVGKFLFILALFIPSLGFSQGFIDACRKLAQDGSAKRLMEAIVSKQYAQFSETTWPECTESATQSAQEIESKLVAELNSVSSKNEKPDLKTLIEEKKYRRYLELKEESLRRSQSSCVSQDRNPGNFGMAQCLNQQPNKNIQNARLFYNEYAGLLITLETEEILSKRGVSKKVICNLRKKNLLFEAVDITRGVQTVKNQNVDSELKKLITGEYEENKKKSEKSFADSFCEWSGMQNLVPFGYSKPIMDLCI